VRIRGGNREEGKILSEARNENGDKKNILNCGTRSDKVLSA
jgi:hypothetical protein